MIQLQFINRVLQDKDPSLITLNNLGKDYFSEYPEEFEFINNHIKTYNKVPDVETFINKFPDFEICEVHEPNTYLLKELSEKRKTNLLALSFNKIRDLIYDNKIDEATAVYKNIYDQLSTTNTITSVDLLKDLSRYDAYVERLGNFDKFYIKTGFKELDKIIGGWDREEELATIVARTNYGKTWIMLKCASSAVEQGLNVGIYSGEMSERKVGYRIDTLLGHISNGGLIHGNESIQNEYKRYIESLPTKYKGSLKVLTPQSIGGPAGVSALRSFIQKENLDILFIDQHSLLEDDRRAKTPVERASNISRDLKNLQVMEKIPIVAVSQQNRSSTEAGVDTTMIAQSDRIGQDSTVILFLEKKDNELKIKLVKSRDSENGKELKYIVDFNTGNFTFVPDEDDTQNSDQVEELRQRYEIEESVGVNLF